MSDQSFEVGELRAAYAAGASAEAIVDEAFDRIEAADDPGIFLHLETRDAMLAAAAALGPYDPGKPLWGVPVAIKDNIDVAGQPTTAACPAFAYTAAEDAAAVAALRRDGALILGKTNLDQFATGLVGVRTPYPVPRNPHDATRIPGGSSSGSAVAVARGLVSLALGTDTAGSGRVPAGLNGIVGLKPSLGLVSTRGVVPACRTLDCVSIFALTVADAWTGLASVSGFDAADPYSRPFSRPSLAARPPVVRVGVPDAGSRRFFGDSAAEAAFDAALEVLAAEGWELVEHDFAPLFAVAALLYEGAWVAERQAAIADFRGAAPADALHPVTAGIIDGARRLTAADAFRGFYRLMALRREAQAVLDGVEALVVPTVPRFFTLDELARDPLLPNSRLGTYTNFVNLLDLCGLAVPTLARPDGLPAGITLLAGSGRDGLLATLGATLETRCDQPLGATGWRRRHPPAFQTEAREPGVLVAVVGAHMRGMPLNPDLLGLGASFVRVDRTTPAYRLYDLPGASPPKPGLLRVSEEGAAIELELWRLDHAAFGRLVASVPSPLTIGDVRLGDGSLAKGYLVEAAAVAGAPDISAYGGWRGYRAAAG
ncbi:MAG: allophanate hydrolase [Amaricoccus sp.]